MRILIAEDDPVLADALRRTLRQSGYAVDWAQNGGEADAALDTNEFDLLILDITLPKLCGFEVLRRLRARNSRLPVLMLTALDSVNDRVRGLDAGADDYLAKPFALEELLARLRALLRRMAPGTEEVSRFADLELNPGTREVKRGGAPIELTRTEFNLLELFMRNPRQVLTRSVIFERVWGYDFGFASNSLDVYIGYLRRKTEIDEKPRLIQTVRGVGYALREP